MYIALTMAMLHNLEVTAVDVLNAFVKAPNRKKVLCSEFGENAGKSSIIVRSLYGLKSAGTSFRAHVAQ